MDGLIYTTPDERRYDDESPSRPVTQDAGNGIVVWWLKEGSQGHKGR